MNTISSFSVKMAAIQLAVDSKPDPGKLLEDAQAIYEWLAEEIEFDQPESSVTHLSPVN